MSLLIADTHTHTNTLCPSQVQSLAQELQVDRTTVLYWVKDFWKKPEL